MGATEHACVGIGQSFKNVPHRPSSWTQRSSVYDYPRERFSSSIIKMFDDKDVSLLIIFLWKGSSFNQLIWFGF